MFWALEWYIHMIHCLSFECCIALWMHTGRDLFWMHGESLCSLRDWYSMLLRHTFVYTKLQQSSMCISYPLKSNEHNVIYKWPLAAWQILHAPAERVGEEEVAGCHPSSDWTCHLPTPISESATVHSRSSPFSTPLQVVLTLYPP